MMRPVYLRRLDRLRENVRATWPFSVLLAVVFGLAWSLLGALAQWVDASGVLR